MVKEPHVLFICPSTSKTTLILAIIKAILIPLKEKKNPWAKLDLVFEYRKLYQDYGNRKEFEISM